MWVLEPWWMKPRWPRPCANKKLAARRARCVSQGASGGRLAAVDVPNLLITPHTAALTDKLWERHYALFSENFRHYLTGDRCSPGWINARGIRFQLIGGKACVRRRSVLFWRWGGY